MHRKNKLQVIGLYFITFIVPTSFVVVSFWPVGFYSNYIATPGDYLWFQAVIQTVSQSGLVDSTFHLNWPLGWSTWSHPQAGFGILLISLIGSKIFLFSTFGTYVFLLCVAAGLSSMSILFFLRSFVGRKLIIITVIFSITIASSPFTLQKLAHLNVAMFYLIPIVLGALIRWHSSKRKQKILLIFLVFISSFLSPFWWVSVAFILIVSASAAIVFHYRAKGFISLISLGGASILGATVPLLLSMNFIQVGGSPTRNPWDSNIYGGHLTDFLTASPYLNLHFQRFNNLLEGQSVEGSQVGIWGGLSALFALFCLLSFYKPKRVGATRAKLLILITLVSVLLFTLGGLGNFQAGVAVFFGTESPARVWARLSVIISVIGLAWILVFIYSILLSKKKLLGISLQVMLAIFSITTTFIDSSATKPLNRSILANDLPEYPAVNFLESTLDPCPIAQLPVDSTPIPKVIDWANYDDYYYRSYIPFLLAPDFYWSYGDTSIEEVTPAAESPVSLNLKAFEFLRDSGYCAILFDKQASGFAVKSNLEVPGQIIDELIVPDFISERYSVYLLRTD